MKHLIFALLSLSLAQASFAGECIVRDQSAEIQQITDSVSSGEITTERAELLIGIIQNARSVEVLTCLAQGNTRGLHKSDIERVKETAIKNHEEDMTRIDAQIALLRQEGLNDTADDLAKSQKKKLKQHSRFIKKLDRLHKNAL